MTRLLPRRSDRHTLAAPRRTRTICVVDPQPADYLGWESLAQAGGVELCFVADAEQALRLSRTQPVDLWVINTELPGLSGYELCGMLKAQHPRSTVFVVADKYSAAAERLAWAHRATLFSVKPEQYSWLSLWEQSRSRRSEPSF